MPSIAHGLEHRSAGSRHTVEGHLRVADWRTMFLMGGIAPLVVAVLLVVFLPESIRLLLADNRDPGRSRRIPARAPNLTTWSTV